MRRSQHAQVAFRSLDPARATGCLAVLVALLLTVLSSPAAAAAERFDLRPGPPGASTPILVVPADIEGLSVIQEILVDGRVVDSVELDAPGPDGRLPWRPGRADAIADGSITVRFVVSVAQAASGESVFEAFVAAGIAHAGVVALVAAPERAAREGTTWHPDDTVLEAAFAGPAAKGGVALPPPPDPTTRQTYDCHYIRSANWNYGGDGVPAVLGKIRWPSASCDPDDGPPTDRPVVVFTHGRDMDHKDHDYLMRHLAKNGFVAASVSNGDFDGGSNEGRARQAISFLNSMHATWAWSHRLSDRVAFAGHSRGGEAAITAARLLDETPSLGHEDFEVRAVIAIAPTDGGGANGVFPKEILYGSMTQGFLGLYGTRDPDVTGDPIEPWPTEPEDTVFAIYDRAGGEHASEGIQFVGIHLSKAMVFLDRATHTGFLDDDQCFNLASALACEDHRNAAKGYINAFLRWHVYDQTDHRGFFDGTWRPPALADLDLAQQYSGGYRRVIDNFEQVGWNASTIGGPVQKSTHLAGLEEDELIDLDPANPHDTRGMRIEWGDSGAQWVRWKIPDVSVAYVGPLRDLTDYSYLSLRAGQTYDDPGNTPGEAQDFRVRLYTGLGWSSKVAVGAYADLAYPDVFSAPVGTSIEAFTKTTMETIRVPLSAFANADLTDVRWVAIYFDAPGHDTGSVQIDSVEFAN